MFLARCLLLILAVGIAAPVGGFVSPAHAQSSTQVSPPDYAAWNATASRAESAIEAGRASDRALEILRSSLADWRTQFLAGQTANAPRIATLNEQIAALGPLPENGGTEAEDIAARRTELNIQLARLRAPVLAAEEAYSRADGLIREIDTILRDRQADALLELGPTPLNPVNWAAGLSALGGTMSSIAAETEQSWGSSTARYQAGQNLPAIIVLVLAALALLMRGRRWTEQLGARIAGVPSLRGRLVMMSILSLGQIVLPFVGLMALLQAVNLTGLAGPHAERVLGLIPGAGLTILVARWLAGRVFHKIEGQRKLVELNSARRAEGRWDFGGLGVLMALAGFFQQLGEREGYGDAAVATIVFPIIVVAAILLFRTCQLVLLHLRNSRPADAADRPYMLRAAHYVTHGLMLIAVVGPVLAAIGYMKAGGFLVFPAVQTLALFAVVTVLQRFVGDVYAFVTGAKETDTDALIPVLIGFILAIAALPVLALIWGARVSFLTEMWTKFTAGFSIGETRISPSDFLTFAIVFAVGYMLTRLLQGTMRSTVLPRTGIDTGGRNAIVSGIGYIGMFLAAVISISYAGIDLSSIAIVAGALSVGIGFGLQTVVSNFVSGIILLIERPVTEGDWIEVSGVMGTVRDISVRSTRIETFDRTDVIVPNADLISGMVTNWTRHNLTGRIILTVGAAYGTDTRKVEKILREVAEAHPIVIINPPPLVLFTGFGADSLDFEIRAILRDVNFSLSVRSDINHEIARRFAEEGIEIPFAQRDIWLRNPEALAGGGAGHAAPGTTATPLAASQQPMQYDDPSATLDSDQEAPDD